MIKSIRSFYEKYAKKYAKSAFACKCDSALTTQGIFASEVGGKIVSEIALTDNERENPPRNLGKWILANLVHPKRAIL